MQANHEKVARLLKTARGQLDGILKMVEEDRYCIDISNQLLATQAVLRRANEEIIRAHLKGCVRKAMQSDASAADASIEELIAVFDKLAR